MTKPKAKSKKRNHFLVGFTVKSVRKMTKAELQNQGWDDSYPPMVIVLEASLSGGTQEMKLYASRDEEGNGPGAMFGIMPNGYYFQI